MRTRWIVLVAFGILLWGIPGIGSACTCADEDGDGYGAPASEYCPFPEEDCDDSNPEVNPGAVEVCNGIDDNCDGAVDDVDADGDGYIAEACGGSDCDDGNPSVNIGAVEGCCLEETCFDGIDNDCDGLTDAAEQACNEWCMGAAEAYTVGVPDGSVSRRINRFAFLLLPLALILVWRRTRRKP